MSEVLKLNIGLDKSGRKYNCPQCGQKRFVKMFDFETKEYLPDEVGRCDRESSCGYHKTVKQYYSEKDSCYVPKIKIIEVKEEKVDFMPMEYILRSQNNYDSIDFGKYIISLFGKEICGKVFKKYNVGRSKFDVGKAIIFWQVDYLKRVRTGKIMKYNPNNGKRIQDEGTWKVLWVHSNIKDFNFKQCFFGEHLLNVYPTKTVGIVESEKTAILASIFIPDIVWLATGGKRGCKWREWSVFNVLENRDVILFPDRGCYIDWNKIAMETSNRMTCRITVSKVLEEIESTENIDGLDLADFLVIRKENKSWALNEIDGYPIMWDL